MIKSSSNEEEDTYAGSTLRMSELAPTIAPTVNLVLVSCIKGTGRDRFDLYGNDIVQRNEEAKIDRRKSKVPQKITFKDMISGVDEDPNPEKHVLAEVVYVESYKKYNVE